MCLRGISGHETKNLILTSHKNKHKQSRQQQTKNQHKTKRGKGVVFITTLSRVSTKLNYKLNSSFFLWQGSAPHPANFLKKFDKNLAITQRGLHSYIFHHCQAKAQRFFYHYFQLCPQSPWQPSMPHLKRYPQANPHF